MLITRENYHSLEADREYMSRGLYLRFLKCEAQSLAYLSGEWKDEPSDALLVGQYVHSWSEGIRQEFISEHPEMFTKAGGLRAEFKCADRMIECLQDDPLVMYVLQGQKEVIFTAEFAGAMWKVMADVYSPERKRMADLKTTKSIRTHEWSADHGKKVSFVESYNYLLQAALYCEIERRASGRESRDWLDFLMVAVSKENVPDKEVIDLIDPDRYAIELAAIEARMPRVLAVKAREVDPTRCECCDYCRSTKILTGAIHYSLL